MIANLNTPEATDVQMEVVFVAVVGTLHHSIKRRLDVYVMLFRRLARIV